MDKGMDDKGMKGLSEILQWVIVALMLHKEHLPDMLVVPRVQKHT